MIRVKHYLLNTCTLAILAVASLSWGSSETVEDFFIHTTTDSVTTEFSIANSSGSTANCTWQQLITDDKDAIILDSGLKNFKVEAKESVKKTFKEYPKNVELWSPEHPNLYEVTTTITFEDNPPVIYRNNLGFRSFEIRKHHFYLNGKPYFLKGLSRIPPGRVFDKNSEFRPDIWRDEKFVKDFYEKIKSANINTIRICGNIEEDMIWVDYADKYGIMLINGSYSGEGAMGSDIVERNRKIFEPIIRSVRNHTSPVIYTLSNELQWDKNPDFLPGIKANYKIAKSLDPTRAIIGNAGFGEGKAGDIEDIHDYLGWYYGSVTKATRYASEDKYSDKEAGKPITFTEMIGTYTNGRDGSFYTAYNKHLGNALRLIGTSSRFAEDSLWYQALITKEMIEAMRRARGEHNRICGTLPFSTYWFWDTDNKKAIAKPAVEKISMSYSPVLLSLNTWNRNIYAGDKFKSYLYVVNDDCSLGTLKDAKVKIELVKDDVVLNTVIESLPDINYYDTKKKYINIDIPKDIQAGTASIVLTLLAPNADCEGNETEIFVAPRDFAVVTNSTEPIAVYDPSGSAIERVRKAGFTVTEVSALDSLSPDKKLIIADNAAGKNSQINITAFWNYVNNGGEAIVLEQDSFKDGMLPHGFDLKKTEELFVNIDRRETLPLLDGLRHRDLFAFNNVNKYIVDSYTIKNAFELTSDVLDQTEVIANCSTYLRRAAIVEYFSQDGSVIYSQLECASRAGDDPIADKAFTNLIRTFAAYDNEFGEDSGWIIDFTDFDSERGIFALPLEQGIIINSHNYGRVSYGDVRSTGWAADFYDGRRVVGPQHLYRSIGYLEAENPAGNTAEGSFWVNPPQGANAAFIKVTNPTNKPLAFKISAGAHAKRFVVKPETTEEFGPIPIKRSDNNAVKIIIQTTVDKEGAEKDKKLIEELIFNSMKFTK